MSTWNAYYDEYLRHQILLEEARQYRLIKACLNNKASRATKTSFRIESTQNRNNKVLVLENK